jgi:hypothetical protein
MLRTALGTLKLASFSSFYRVEHQSPRIRSIRVVEVGNLRRLGMSHSVTYHVKLHHIAFNDSELFKYHFHRALYVH